MKLMMLKFTIMAVVLIMGCDTQQRTFNVDDSDKPDMELAAGNPTSFNHLQKSALGDRIVNFAAQLEGTPYQEAGRDMSGFDCSGFVYYVYKQHNVEVPHSSRHLAELGTEVDTSTAQPGDLVFFKGTNPENPEVGHVGIVVSSPGEPLKFIHASSAATSAYVKYDSLARPNYNRRFLKVKRLLKNEKL
jgi:cell wall-associated NlpC family hydrolase